MKTRLTKNLFAKLPFNPNLFRKDLFKLDRLASITPARHRTLALAAAGLAVSGGAIAGPILGGGSPADAAPTARAGMVVLHESGVKAAPSAAAVKAQVVASQPQDKDVAVDYQPQSTFFYCGPAATRIAATAQGQDLSQDDLAGKLGTTVNGTNSAQDTTRVLNSVVGGDKYHTTSIPGSPDQAQADQVQTDVMRSLTQGRAVVANIAGQTTDVTGAEHDFAGGHYLTVTGYHDHGDTVRISDPADVNGASDYWISTNNLAHWMATRGYSS